MVKFIDSLVATCKNYFLSQPTGMLTTFDSGLHYTQGGNPLYFPESFVFVLMS
jgi:hypothetical protein